MNKFTVFYEGGSQFSGGPLDHDWYKIDEGKKIIKLEYFLDKIGVMLEGYIEYNHCLEYAAMGAKGVQRILLMGRTNEETEIVVLDLKQNKVYKDYKPKYREYGEQILNGWQKGKLDKPKAVFKKIK
ncbi:hypothetical protein LCGC14_2842680 [marine sediment metagenome]|uniref:Uncharacterized protein n=1 Tax=marine sediment metagenome TaxID=412755 RepID=A0A0F8YAW5_9ZZZZ